MSTKTCPIVGSYYRPPANALIKHMPHRTKLVLRPEPENPYDPNAIMVLVRGSEVETDYDLDQALIGYGTNIAEVQAGGEYHLGYIPRGLAATMALPGEIEGTFLLDARGKPQVQFELE
jgi:hypothetical protein